MCTCSVVETFHVFSLKKKSGKVLLPLWDHLEFLTVPLRPSRSFGGRRPRRLYVHGWHALVEDLRPHQLDAGHDLLLVAHQRHAESLDVPARHVERQTFSTPRLAVGLDASSAPRRRSALTPGSFLRRAPGCDTLPLQSDLCSGSS